MNKESTLVDIETIEIETTNNAFDSTLELLESNGSVFIYRFSLLAVDLSSPSPISIKWKLPALSIKGVWKSGSIHNKRLQYDWELEHLQSRISVDAPVISVFGHNDQNIITFACSDAINLVEMNALLREEDNHLYCHLSLFQERHPAIDQYNCEIRIDLMEQTYVQALQNTSRWWSAFEHLKPIKAAPLASVPVYSTWYQFHQDLDAKVLIEESTLAKSLGLELIIIDDGWQTLNTNRGYDYTGDWKPERFPDMAALVEELHQTGIKVGLWFSIPFCGKHSKAYQKFAGKFLTENHRWAPVFDPRYPEIRAHLIQIYINALREWNLDAFKFDFIDDFRVYEETELTKANGRDYANVNEAVDRLFADATTALRAIKSDLAIEFRQKYVGPAMRKYGDMFRAFDCPNDPVTNRIRTTDVKLLGDQSIVHSDMLTWHINEEVEIAALQVLNGIFAVPQISVLLHTLPDDHINMVRFYTEYWSNNKAILLDGQFYAANPLGNYPILKSALNLHQIIGVYDDILVELEEYPIIDLLNGKTSKRIIIKNDRSVIYEMTIWNCEGIKLSTEELKLNKSMVELNVPVAGMIRLEIK